MKTTITAICLGAMVAMPLLAQSEKEAVKKETPYTKANNSWISVSGKVTKAGPDGFTLDYGKGAVSVEMDDWDWYKEGYQILEGDNVTVDGVIDRDKGETTSIEASSVFVKGLNTYFYASAVDDEDVPRILVHAAAAGSYVLQGAVTAIDGREFTLNDGFSSIVIDTKTLNYNPMDIRGFQQIQLGDLVRVYGTLDKGVLEPDEIHPTAIITMRKF